MDYGAALLDQSAAVLAREEGVLDKSAAVPAREEEVLDKSAAVLIWKAAVLAGTRRN